MGQRRWAPDAGIGIANLPQPVGVTYGFSTVPGSRRNPVNAMRLTASNLSVSTECRMVKAEQFACV